LSSAKEELEKPCDKKSEASAISVSLSSVESGRRPPPLCPMSRLGKVRLLANPDTTRRHIDVSQSIRHTI
ncbi:unnamed protein product, partial [Vitrella brassicaformis CCMP3155]